MTPPSSPSPLIVGINPTSGKGKAQSIAQAAVAKFRTLGFDVVSVVADSDPELRQQLRQALAADHRALVVVGGDGVVHASLQVLRDFPDTPLGIVPAGTGNDIARAVGLDETQPLSAVSAIVQALDSPPRFIDLGEADHAGAITRFGAVYSAGFDALVNERANRLRWPKGTSRYTVAMLLELSTMTPRHYRLTIDNQVSEVEALLVAVANAESFGGGMRIVPDTPIDDGLLQVFTVSPVSRLEFIRLYPRVFSGTHISHPAVNIVRAETVRVEVDGIVGYADGERVGQLPVDIRVVPRGLQILA